MKNLTKKSVRAGAYLGSFNAIDRVFSLIKIGVLARVLTPGQFGVFGILSLSLGLLETFSEVGVSQYLIQKDRPDDNDRSSAFWLHFVRAVVISGLLFAGAPLVARFFDQPRIEGLLKIVALAPLIRGLVNPRVAELEKNLEFNKKFGLMLAKSLTEVAVAIAVSLQTRTIAGLVWALVAGAVAEVVMSYLLSKPFRVTWPGWGPIKEQLKFSKWIWSASLLSYVTNNGDDLVVGKFLPTAELGFYQNAYKIASLPATQVTSVIAQVSFPAFAKIQNDKVRLKRAFLKTFGLALVVSVAATIGMVGLARPIVWIVLGNDWLEVVPVLRVLAIYGGVRALTSNFGSLFIAAGRPDMMTRSNVIQAVVLAMLVVPLTMKYGIVGTAWSTAIAITAAKTYLGFKLNEVWQ